MIALNDLIGYKASFRSPWRLGYLEAREGNTATVRDARQASSRTVLVLRGKGRKGKLKELRGAEAVDAAETLRREGRLPRTDPHFAPAGPADEEDPERARLPPIRVVVVGPGPLRPVPARRKRWRCAAFRAFVSGFACCSCRGKQTSPSEAHHDGDRGVSQKADDLCAPLCRACHQHYTDENRLPGRTREQSLIIILRAQLACLFLWTVGRDEGATLAAAG